MTHSQNNQIKDYMQRGFEITHQQARKLFSCTNLEGAIDDLKGEGCEIESRWLDVGDKSFKAYRMRIDKASLSQSVGL